MADQPSRIGRAASMLRQHGARIAAEVAVNFLLPFIIYLATERPFGDLGALLASSAPPILWSGFEFVRRRRVDAISLLVLTGILLSLLAVASGGSVHFLQLREKLVTALIGLIFIGSVLVKRPLIYEIARANMLRKSKEQADSFSALRAHADFRRTVTIMTLVTGLGLIADAGVSALLVMALSIRDYLIVGPILGYTVIGALGLWVIWYGQYAKRRSEAKRAVADGDDVPAQRDGVS